MADSKEEEDEKGNFAFPNTAILGDGKLVLVPSQIPGAGWGVQSRIAWKRGDWITEYQGHIIGFVQASKATTEERSHMRSLFSIRYVIDGRFTPKGKHISDPRKDCTGLGLAAWINDAKGGMNTIPTQKADKKKDVQEHSVSNNVEFDTITTADCDPFDPRPEQRRVYVRALRDIRVGEELFVSYGRDYWARYNNKTNE